MPRPVNLDDVFRPLPPLPYPRGWADEFGPYDWTYLAGFAAACSALGLHHDREGRTTLNRYCDAAVGAVPAGWKTFFVDPDTRKKGWNEFGPKQFRKAFRNKPMRIDKAALAALALELYAAEHVPTVDPWTMLTLRPAIFVINLYDKRFYNTHISPRMNAPGPFQADVLTAILQSNAAVVSDLAKGIPVTAPTAQRYLDFLSAHADFIGILRASPLGPVTHVVDRVDASLSPCLKEYVLNN